MARKRRRKTSHVKHDSQQDELIRAALLKAEKDPAAAERCDEYIRVMKARLKANPLCPHSSIRPAFPRSTQGCRVIQSPEWWDNLGDAADV